MVFGISAFWAVLFCCKELISFQCITLQNILQVGIAYLLALESANDMNVTPLDNIEYDR